jgi:serine/threonine protein kinase
MLQIAQGLHYLHSMNVVHCDLSGNKTLISDDYCAVLSDFGLATTIWDGDLDTTAGTFVSSHNRTGSVQWFGLELISSEQFGCKKFLRTR